MTQLSDFAHVTDVRFADIQILRYNLPGFSELTPRQKAYIYYLSEATLWGRDIIYDQWGRYNLLIRKTLEAIFKDLKDLKNLKDFTDLKDFEAFEEYLFRVWFSNGIHHHYGMEKFEPKFSEQFFEEAVRNIPASELPMPADQLLELLIPVIFDSEVMPKRVSKAKDVDLIQSSSNNFYQGVTQTEVENYYANKKGDNPTPPSYGLNSTLVKKKGKIYEDTWCLNGKYGEVIKHIIENLNHALQYTENEQQKRVISFLIDYYTTGNLNTFDKFSIEWLKELEGRVDFINGFIEVYGDPLGFKGSWEGIVEYKDLEACQRTQTISQNAQWFEDHSPVDPRFRKPHVKGVVANAVCGAMLGGDEYPSTAIGINLPNADWIRTQHGSKSVTITNFTDAYNKAAKGSGFLEEFALDEDTIKVIRKYGDVCDDLHTDLHECLGHGSGQMLPGVSPDALKAYGNTIEEARADLFGLYYIADKKLVDLGLTPNEEAYKSNYYTYIMNGMMTQNVRIKLGDNIEEAHMRNRALIANWCYAHSDGIIEIVERDGKHFIKINDYSALRQLFATLLSEIQRIKSEGDYEAAQHLVETYAVKINPELHKEVLARYEKLNIAPYKGFLNPVMTPVFDKNGEIIDVTLDFTETYVEQMLRYSRDYSAL